MKEQSHYQPDQKQSSSDAGEVSSGFPEQKSEKQTRPYRRRLKLNRFGPGRDLAPYTPEEEEEIRSGVPEWEIQSRRIRDRSCASDVEGEKQTENAQGPKKSSYEKHREKKLEYQRKYNQQHKAEVQEQQNRKRQTLSEESEEDLT